MTLKANEQRMAFAKSPDLLIPKKPKLFFESTYIINSIAQKKMFFSPYFFIPRSSFHYIFVKKG